MGMIGKIVKEKISKKEEKRKKIIGNGVAILIKG